MLTFQTVNWEGKERIGKGLEPWKVLPDTTCNILNGSSCPQWWAPCFAVPAAHGPAWERGGASAKFLVQSRQDGNRSIFHPEKKESSVKSPSRACRLAPKIAKQDLVLCRASTRPESPWKQAKRRQRRAPWHLGQVGMCCVIHTTTIRKDKSVKCWCCFLPINQWCYLNKCVEGNTHNFFFLNRFLCSGGNSPGLPWSKLGVLWQAQGKIPNLYKCQQRQNLATFPGLLLQWAPGRCKDMGHSLVIVGRIWSF